MTVHSVWRNIRQNLHECTICLISKISASSLTPQSSPSHAKNPINEQNLIAAHVVNRKNIQIPHPHVEVGSCCFWVIFTPHFTCNLDLFFSSIPSVKRNVCCWRLLDWGCILDLSEVSTDAHRPAISQFVFDEFEACAASIMWFSSSKPAHSVYCHV